MPDAEYREQANELAIALSESHVKGVFEERLPLEVHAALQLGCVTAVAPHSRSKSMQDGFDLADLQVCLQSLTLPFMPALIQSFIHCLHSFTHSCIHSYQSIRTNPFNNSFIPAYLIHSLIQSFIHSVIHSVVRSYGHSLSDSSSQVRILHGPARTNTGGNCTECSTAPVLKP